MTTAFSVDIPPQEILGWIKADRQAAGGHLDYWVGAHKDYVLEEDFDREGYALDVPEDYDLVTATAEVSVEPRVERNYWVLQVRVESDMGPCRQCSEDEFSPEELTLDAFEREFLAPGKGRVSVRLEAETADAKQHFDAWLAGMRQTHQAA